MTSYLNINDWLTATKHQKNWIKSYIKQTFKTLSNGSIGSINVNIINPESYELEIIPSQPNESKKITINTFAKSIYRLYPRWDQSVIESFCNTGLKSEKINLKKLKKELLRLRKTRERKLEYHIKNRETFNIKKTWNEFRVVRKGENEDSINSILSSPEKAISGGSLITGDQTTTICKVTTDSGKEVIIKRYNSKGFIYSIFRSAIDSRAWVCWKGAELFKWIGVPTPQTLGMLEVRSGLWIKKSYLITEYIPGKTLAEFFEEGHDQTHWNHVADQVGDILLSLPKVLVAHGDFKSTNILVENNAPILIDLDSFHSYKFRPIFNRTYKKDLKRFERNWIDAPSASKVFRPIIKQVKNIL